MFEMESSPIRRIHGKSEERESQARKRKFFKALRLKGNIPDEERRMLEETVRLDDGTYGECIAIRKNDNGLVYECHLCKCYAKNLTYNNFLPHYRGKTHKMNLIKPVHSKNKFILKSPNLKLKLNLNTGPLAPCKIQKSLDKFKLPLIGLEYLLEVVVPNEPLSYYCLLCCKQTNTSSTFTHLTSTGHYLQYFYMFFRTVTRQISIAKERCSSKKKIKDKIEAIAGKIEKCFGRLKPRRVTVFELENKLSNILDSIDSGPHFRETPDRTFVDHLDNASRQAELHRGNEIQEQSAYDPSIQDLEYESALPPFNENDAPLQEDERIVDISRLDEDERRFYEYTRLGPTNQIMWTIYREKAQKMESDLLEEMMYYQKNPEKHPKYESERMKYFSERTEFLLRNGEDSMLYDIKGEFIALWDTLLKDMFHSIFIKEKSDLRKQLESIHREQTGQSMGYKQLQAKVEEHNRPRKKSNYDSSSQNDAQPQTEFQDYDRVSRNKRSYDSLRIEDQLSDMSSKRLRPTYDVEDSANSTSSASVISVLRRLTVLEDHLGSLGPKVVDLLSDALLLDKTSPNDSVLSREKNCVLLETVKEKIIGLLQAGVMEATIKGVAEKAVCNIIQLLAAVEKEKMSYSDKRPSHDESYYGEPSTSYQDEGTPFQEESICYEEPRTTYRGENEHYQEETTPHQVIGRPYQKDMKHYHEEDMYYQDKSPPFQEERKSYHSERKPYQEERKHFDYETSRYSPSRSLKRENVTENIRSFKVSEISEFIENLGSLSHLPFLEKTSISQEIASKLIFQRQTEIKKDELLQLINTFLKKKELKNKRSSTDFFDKPTSGYQQRSHDHDRYSQADNITPGRSLTTFPNVYESPAHSALKALIDSESTSYLQNKEKFTGVKNQNNMDHNSSVLSSKSYTRFSQRPY